MSKLDEIVVSASAISLNTGLDKMRYRITARDPNKDGGTPNKLKIDIAAFSSSQADLRNARGRPSLIMGSGGSHGVGPHLIRRSQHEATVIPLSLASESLD